MKANVTKAQAAAVLKAATELVDLICEIKDFDDLSPEWGALYDRFVDGALGEIMPEIGRAHV